MKTVEIIHRIYNICLVKFKDCYLYFDFFLSKNRNGGLKLQINYMKTIEIIHRIYNICLVKLEDCYLYFNFLGAPASPAGAPLIL